MRKTAAILFIFLAMTQTGAKPNFMTLEEQRIQRQVETARKSGFADFEIDNLHREISKNLLAIKAINDKGLDKQSARYLTDIPNDNIPDLFLKDSGGKPYLEMEIAHGESFSSYPRTFLYQSKVYLYPSADLKSIEKIILQFKRTNSSGSLFIREMRRVINETPKFTDEEADDPANVQPDDNSDIRLEYYTSNDGVANWKDIPDIEQKPGISVTLNEAENPLPYFKQRSILEEYKKVLRILNKTVSKKLYMLELDRKRMASKLIDFY